ncbi:MAG: polysaccharide pyruvyl transferase family protein [Planctomycetota bacterium]
MHTTAEANPHAPADEAALPKVDQALESLKGLRVYFDPIWGNNGDDLIRWGAERALQRHGLDLTRELSSAQAIVVNGGGSLIDIRGPSRVPQDNLKRYAQAHADKPLVVLPSSVLFEDTDFGSFFAGRETPAWVFARERISLEQMRRFEYPPAVQLGLDNDMAFQLQDAPVVERLKRSARSKHLLIVERADLERVSGEAIQAMPGPNWLKQAIPPALRMTAHRLRARLKPAQPTTEFAQQALALLKADGLAGDADPIIYGDISEPRVCSSERFLRLIADAKAVVSTRLHVGILAAMIGKPTIVVKGRYHKILGIHDYSMADWSHVRLWDPKADS